jgi:hypothetical protein
MHLPSCSPWLVSGAENEITWPPCSMQGVFLTYGITNNCQIVRNNSRAAPMVGFCHTLKYISFSSKEVEAC